MTSNLTISRFLAISTLALALPMTALAKGNDSDRCAAHNRQSVEMHHGHGMPDLRGIDLTAGQIAKLTELRDAQRKTFADNAALLHEQHDALNKFVMSEAYTPEAAREIIAKIGAVQSEMARLHAEQSHKLYEILTPEQRTRLQQNELMSPRMKGHGSMY